MKKTLLALSVLVASSAANAGIEVYNKDGATVNIGGDLEVVYVKGTAQDASMQQEIQDADIKFDIRYAVNEELSVGGYWEFQGDKDDTTEHGSDKMGDVYFAFYTATYGSVKVGDTCNIGDDLGVGSDYQFGVTSTIDQAEVCGDETIRYDYSSDMFYASAAFRDDQRADSDVDLADFKVGVKVAGFDILGYYGTSGTAEQDASAVEVRYALESANLEAGYYNVEDKGDTIALAADYTMDKLTFAAGIDFVKYDDSATEDETNYFVNAGYAIAPATTIYAEIGGNDKDNSEVGYAVGAKVAF